MAEPRVTETGVPIDHLDYTYVRNCKNIKEVEKILRVLRYGCITCTCSVYTVRVRVYESCYRVNVGLFVKFARSRSEGYYPDLIRFTEDRLYELCPQR